MTNEEIVQTLTETDARSKSNTHRLDKMERRQDELDELVTSVALMAQRQETLENDVKEIKADVKTLAEKPAKRWDGIVDKALWLLIGAALAALFAQGGIAV